MLNDKILYWLNFLTILHTTVNGIALLLLLQLGCLVADCLADADKINNSIYTHIHTYIHTDMKNTFTALFEA